MDLPSFVLLIFVLLFSVILHEIAHGWVALKFGDPTAKEAGRLTLNPISHIDPVGTIILPGVMAFLGGPIFGWAKPVPVDTGNLKPRVLGQICVSLAGVATNLFMAVAAGLIIRFNYNWLNSSESLVAEFLGGILAWAVFVNITLGLFNLLPIPPLDGSRLVTMWLPASTQERFERMSIIFLALLIFLIPYLKIGLITKAVFLFLTGIETMR